jgi:hypothetical protein
VGVAQLVRAPGCGPGGRRFNSGRPPSEVPQNKAFSGTLIAGKLDNEKVVREVLTPLGALCIVLARSEWLSDRQALRFARKGVPLLLLLRRWNTPREHPS